MNCPHCQSEVQQNWKVCPVCTERLPESLTCESCGAQLQPGWKACPVCGEHVGGQPASLNITDSVVGEVHQTQTVDRSTNIGGQAETNGVAIAPV